jgi:hypothetical protein
MNGVARSSGASSEQGAPQVSFSLMSIIAVDAILGDLAHRRTASSTLATGQHRHLIDVSFPAALL